MYRLITSFVLLITSLILSSPVGLAQSSQTDWTEPIKLIPQTAEFENGGSFPKIAADVAGNVHVIWIGWTGPANKPSTWAANTLYYTVWDGTKWSDPIDILVSSALDNTLDAGTITTTPDGYVVVSWQRSPNVAVSWAPIEEATNARAWETTLIDQGAEARLAIDPASGRWYVSYTHNTTDVIFAYSENKGRTWVLSRPVWSGIEGTSAPENWGIYVANDGSVHMTWVERVERRSWAGEAIWHARLLSLDQGTFDVREAARSISPEEPTLGAPVMAVGPGGNLHLFWNNGVGSDTGRFHQWSDDNGVTWSEVTPVFPGLSGQTSQAGLTFDSAGVLHLITAADGDGYTQGIRYASWQNQVWSNYTSPWRERYKGEHPALAITGGNQLHLVWDHFTFASDGKLVTQVMYSSRLVDAPFVSPIDFVAPKITPTPHVESSKKPKPTDGTTSSLLTPTPRLKTDFADQPNVETPNPGLPLVLGVVPVVILIVMVVGFRLRQ